MTAPRYPVPDLFGSPLAAEWQALLDDAPEAMAEVEWIARRNLRSGIIYWPDPAELLHCWHPHQPIETCALVLADVPHWLEARTW